MKKVSVVIPCYNCENVVSRAIESVFCQRHKNWELILVDNNSQDNTFQILQSYRDEYPDRVFLLSEFNPGAQYARNKGLSAATGEYVQFLDSDDELLSGKIESQLEIVNKQNVNLVVGNAELIYNEKENAVHSKRNVLVGDSWCALILSQLGITSANLFQRALINDIGGWDVTKESSQEYDLMFRMLKSGKCKIGFDTSYNTRIYINGDSISRASSTEKLLRISKHRIQFRLDIKAFLEAQNLLTPQRSAAIDKYIYTELMRQRRRLPVFVKENLQRFGMSFPLTVRIKDSFHSLRDQFNHLIAGN